MSKVQSEDDGLTTIILNGNNSEVVVGDDGHAGAVIIRDDAGTDRVKIRPQTITVLNDAGQIVIQLDGPSGDVQFGAAGARGQITVHNGEGVATILIGGGEATIELGADGQDGDLLVKDSDGAERIRLDGNDGSLTALDQPSTRDSPTAREEGEAMTASDAGATRAGSVRRTFAYDNRGVRFTSRTPRRMPAPPSAPLDREPPADRVIVELQSGRARCATASCSTTRSPGPRAHRP